MERPQADTDYTLLFLLKLLPSLSPSLAGVAGGEDRIKCSAFLWCTPRDTFWGRCKAARPESTVPPTSRG